MKKKWIITLCVLFTAVSLGAAASCAVSSSENSGPCPCKCGCMKRCPQDNGIMRYKRYVNSVQQSRATIYNALNLTEEQIKTREELLAKNAKTYDEKFQNLFYESAKLKTLKEADACEREINKQRKVVKNIKKEIQSTLDKENKEFKKCLTKEQRSKFNMIKKLEKEAYQKALKHKPDYHKLNPQMGIFGNPPSGCSCK